MSEAYIQLAVRTLVGVICAATGAFFGALIIAMIVSGIEAPDTFRSAARIAFVAVAAGTASRLGWYGVVEKRRHTITLLLYSALAGLIGSWLGLIISSALFQNTDVYILNRDISGAGFFGAVFACNIPSLIHTATLAKKREI